MHPKSGKAENNSVSVVIPVFNEERYLENCLTDLVASLHSHPDSEIIVVDNGSTDKSVEIAKQYATQVYVKTDCNVGAVRNFGANQAKGDVLVFLDSDCTVEKDWIRNGVDRVTSDNSRILGGSLRVRANAGWVERLWLLQDTDTQFKQTDLLGSCIFVQKDGFDSLNGFSETVTSGEDSDFSLRAKKAGFNVEINEQLNVVHLGNPTTLSEFMKRQAWHAENYVSVISKSLKDIVFWLVVLYLVGLVLTSLALLTPFELQYWHLLFLIGPALILGSKRVIRSKYKLKSLVELPGIFILDNCYLLGRSLGLIRGLLRPFLSKRIS